MSDCQHCPRNTNEGRNLCRVCEERLATQLDEIPSLYRALEYLVGTKAKTSGKRTSVEASAPCNIDALNLTAPGGIADILASWVEDWYDLLDWGEPQLDSRDDRVTSAVHRLRGNLPWAVEQHPAVGDFAREIAQLHRRARRVLDGDTPRVPLCACTCGGTVTANPAALVAHCSDCHTEWRGPQLIELAETRGNFPPVPVAA
ncbi:hypothetical protein [Streptomyces boncukensis]|uniref:Uncharacterized protein n=1 Tax=Streptomyces boncukensis TaxID=2711219 RepID=A0A6G4WQP4_9ACTN|nr:hypothetical protein [Streptomyces boncukensis]NGO67152.1 hypothetical protein [Streptomyces boncukensis]